MTEYIPLLKDTVLFSGLKEEEITMLLSCLEAKEKSYKKGEILLNEGQILDSILILLSGKLHIQSNDYWGNRSIVHEVTPLEMLAESYAASNTPILNDVIVIEDSTLLFLNMKKLLTLCTSSCPFHTEIIKNLFFSIAGRNRMLVQKIGCLQKRSTREKLIAYLSNEAKKQKSNNFKIPFSREQLASFLAVDRSAMSNELSKMRKEGLLDFRKNHFSLQEKEIRKTSELTNENL